MTTSFDEAGPRRQLLIAQRLRQRRTDLGLTQKQVVARLARSGLRTTNRALSSLEHGAGLDVAKLPALAEALECTVTYLVGLTNDPHQWEPGQLSRVPRRRAARTPERAADAPVAASRILGADVPDRGPRLRLDVHSPTP